MYICFDLSVHSCIHTVHLFSFRSPHHENFTVTAHTWQFNHLLVTQTHTYQPTYSKPNSCTYKRSGLQYQRLVLQNKNKKWEIGRGWGTLSLKKWKKKKRNVHLQGAINLKSHSFWSQFCGQPIWIILISRVPRASHTSTSLHTWTLPQLCGPQVDKDQTSTSVNVFRYTSVIVD